VTSLSRYSREDAPLSREISGISPPLSTAVSFNASNAPILSQKNPLLKLNSELIRRSRMTGDRSNSGSESDTSTKNDKPRFSYVWSWGFDPLECLWLLTSDWIHSSAHNLTQPYIFRLPREASKEVLHHLASSTRVSTKLGPTDDEQAFDEESLRINTGDRFDDGDEPNLSLDKLKASPSSSSLPIMKSPSNRHLDDPHVALEKLKSPSSSSMKAVTKSHSHLPFTKRPSERKQSFGKPAPPPPSAPLPAGPPPPWKRAGKSPLLRCCCLNVVMLFVGKLTVQTGFEVNEVDSNQSSKSQTLGSQKGFSEANEASSPTGPSRKKVVSSPINSFRLSVGKALISPLNGCRIEDSQISILQTPYPTSSSSERANQNRNRNRPLRRLIRTLNWNITSAWELTVIGSVLIALPSFAWLYPTLFHWINDF
jgi:hypothetical protein